MGLFDYVIPECALPDDGASHVREWQTKDFDLPCMEKYRINSGGRLLKERYHTEDRSDPNATGIFALRGIMTKVHEGWDDMAFHGVLHFYGYDRSGLAPAAPYDPTRWYEYAATFTHGTLESIERVSEPVAPATGVANPVSLPSQKKGME